MMEECHYVYEYRGRSMDGWKRQIHRAASTRVPVSLFFLCFFCFSELDYRPHPGRVPPPDPWHDGHDASGTTGNGRQRPWYPY